MEDVSIMDGIKPKNRAAQIVPYLAHIDELKCRGFTNVEIAARLGMSESTFRYALKRARNIFSEHPDLATDRRIQSFEISHVEKPRGFLDQNRIKENIIKNDALNESQENTHCEYKEEETTEKSPYDWADEVSIKADQVIERISQSTTHIVDDIKIEKTIEPNISHENEVASRKRYGVLPCEDANPETQEPEDWVSEIMRTSKPSRHAHKFNVELKYK